ncbi:MAG: cysteine synthase A [Andreesenia angusta]|nr:cysteine synthase A [Andreesenia angusta]
MSKIANSLTDLIGNTPLLRLNNFEKDEKSKAKIIGKLEYFNPVGSIKDRVGYSMIVEGEKEGRINKDTVIIEPTSGNTGIALAAIASSRGYRLILTMPDTMSVERRNLLKALGAELVLTPGSEGMKGAIREAYNLAEKTSNSIILQQFENPSNPSIHRETTAEEIIRDTDGKVDIFVSAVGTGGTVTGVGEVLKEKIQGVKIVAVEPEESPVLSGGEAGPHKIQGIGAGMVPKIYNGDFVDEIITVSSDEAFETTKKVSKTEGLLVGISSGAALAAALKLAKKEENRDKNIVVILPDTGERYLSTPLFE